MTTRSHRRAVLCGLIVAGALALSGPHLRAAGGPAFTPTGSMATARYFHTATRLVDGKVLITGGFAQNGNNCCALQSAEVYDPATGLFSPTAGDMTTGRSNHTATLLADGKVLIAGGYFLDGTFGPLQSAEVYDPATGTFSPTPGNMARSRYQHTATRLSDGKVLVVGGTDGTNSNQTLQ